MHTDAEYIALVDASTAFVTPVLPEDLVAADGRPRVIGYNGQRLEEPKYCAAVEAAIGKPCVADFLEASSKPFVVRREHLLLLRVQVASHMNAQSFEDAFAQLCTGGHGEHYSHYNIIGNYLWHFHRDAYTWSLRKAETFNHPVYPKAQTQDPDVVAVGGTGTADSLVSSRSLSLMKRFGHVHLEEVFFVMSDYLCVASDFKAGTCALMKLLHYDVDIAKGVSTNFFRDLLNPVGKWGERQMPGRLIHNSPLEYVPKNFREIVAARTDEVTRRLRPAWRTLAIPLSNTPCVTYRNATKSASAFTRTVATESARLGEIGVSLSPAQKAAVLAAAMKKVIGGERKKKGSVSLHGAASTESHPAAARRLLDLVSPASEALKAKRVLYLNHRNDNELEYAHRLGWFPFYGEDRYRYLLDKTFKYYTSLAHHASPPTVPSSQVHTRVPAVQLQGVE